MSRLTQYIDRLWYGHKTVFNYLLWPFSLVFRLVASLRRLTYQRGFKTTYQPDVPLIVVGNISVGGTGKTPLTIYLLNLLKQQGYRPGVVSRGYGGQAQHYPLLVDQQTDPQLCGDEPALIAARAQCPVVVDPQRVRAVKYLRANSDCDVIISDDGLQHYAMGRTLEIAVLDGVRRLGNGFCLPAGPLREPKQRLQQVDFVVCNGHAKAGEIGMKLHFDQVYHLQSGEQRDVSTFSHQSLYAVAAIGNPERFFQQLRQLGLSIETRAFADHHQFSTEDFDFNHQQPILITEKDAVKCRGFAQDNIWVVPVSAELDTAFSERLIQKLSAEV